MPKIKATGPYDLIFANILKGPLIELAPAIASHLATEGRAILSGLLSVQADSVIAAYETAGLSLNNRDDIGEWSTLVLQKS
jgi:ribosomal protein L11 methyltransferase